MIKLHHTCVIALFGVSLTTNGQEICDNGIDDDFDGLIDLNDTIDCVCAGFATSSQDTSLIPNYSFENMNCCPNTFSQLNCADTWLQASTATSDYYNTCGFTSIAGMAPPLGRPDGSGYVGFYNGATDPQYKEYIGACLTNTMVTGTSYTIDFFAKNSRNTAKLKG